MFPSNENALGFYCPRTSERDVADGSPRLRV